MNLQIACGLLVTFAAMVCGTIIICKRMEIKQKDEQDRRAAIVSERSNLTADNYRLLYEDERQRREDAEFREQIKDRELKRARELMKQIKIVEVCAK